MARKHPSTTLVDERTTSGRRRARVSARALGERLVTPRTRAVRPSLRPLLAGGDRRSIADTERARELVVADPTRVAEVAALVEDADWLVSLRALDLLEKLAHDHTDWVAPYRSALIGPVADCDQWERHLQIVRALPSFTWTSRERQRAVQILKRDLEHPQLFVRAWALDSLARFAQNDAALMPVVRSHLARFSRSGRPALAARARAIRRRLAARG